MPKIVDREERRLEITKATADLISEIGIDSVKLTDIAKALGCTTGVITHYFNSKEEILLATARLVNQNLVDRTKEIMENDPDDFLGGAIESLPIDLPRLKEWRTWLSFWGEAVTDSDMGKEIRAQFSAWISSTRKKLEDGIRRGVLREDLDPVRETDNWHAIVDGIGLQAALNPDDWPAERQIRPVQEFVEGLLSNSSSSSNAAQD